MIRVLAVDDHPIFLDGLRAALHAEDITVVGEASSAEAAVQAAAELAPDLVLMDLQLPGGGLEATRAILAARPGTRVLVLTMSEDQRTVSAAVQAGATGYLVKGTDRTTLLDAVRAVAAGNAVFGAGIAGSVLNAMSQSDASAFPQLTAREREILDLLGEGLTNAAIGHRLFVSPKTVRNHVSNVLGKLGVDDREAAALMLRRSRG
ncbi:MAG: response regulator transcription factor [Actinomycetota bacterium]|nr:response regulator transcription factor [Actinomycetota bacterium]